MYGAGGTDGGSMRFFVGLGMMLVGGYLFLNSIRVVSNWGWGYSLYSGGGFSLTSGALLIPLIFGIGIIFYNSQNPLGWILALGSLAALFAGVIFSLRLALGNMSLFELLLVLVLAVGGLGLLLSSLRDLSK